MPSPPCAVKLNANRHVTGVLRGFDQFMNLVGAAALYCCAEGWLPGVPTRNWGSWVTCVLPVAAAAAWGLRSWTTLWTRSSKQTSAWLSSEVGCSVCRLGGVPTDAGLVSAAVECWFVAHGGCCHVCRK